MGIKREGLKHISKLVKKVVKKAKAPKVDKLKTKIHNKENGEMMLQRSKRKKKQETRSLKKISDSCVEGAPCYTHLDSRPFRITIASVYD